MAFSKNDNKSFEKHLGSNGWNRSAYDQDTWLKNGNIAKKSESSGHWTHNGSKDTDSSAAKKSGRY